MLEWEPRRSVGDCAFDRDHRQLVAMTNLIEDALALGDDRQAELLAAKLTAKACDHCRRGHEFLAARRYPGLPEVARRHDRVRGVAAAIGAAAHAGDHQMAERLALHLGLVVHDALQADRQAFRPVGAC